MSDGSQTDVSNESSVTKTPLGNAEFNGSVEHKDPMAVETTPAPEGVPDKFWDPVEGKLRTDDLIKSYQALEAKLGAPKDEAPEADEPGDDDPKDDEPKDDDPKDDEPKGDEPKDEPTQGQVDFQAAMADAQATYAETGELPDEQRKPFLDMGFTSEQIDLYLSGVKATEAALHQTAFEAAGSEDDLNAALAWAKDNWSEKKIVAFNSQMGDLETIKLAVPGLMAAYKAANPGEGHLTNVNSGVTRGDVYTHMDEFQKDLAAADKVRDQVARRDAINKLRRSRAAGTIQSDRKQPFGK